MLVLGFGNVPESSIERGIAAVGDLLGRGAPARPGSRAGATPSVEREQQELRELARGEVVVADEHERPAAVGQRRAERHPLDVVERDPERAQVEEQRLLHRPELAELAEMLSAPSTFVAPGNATE